MKSQSISTIQSLPLRVDAYSMGEADIEQPESIGIHRYVAETGTYSVMRHTKYFQREQQPLH